MSVVKSIKCTNCAAPLDLLGGGRVETVTCSYCKSTLDLNDNYRVLSNFKNTKDRPDLPFKIGMQGHLKGVDYTIIGCVSYQSVGYPISEWTDFLLFSPFYGYAYLTYEEGHLIYSKRNRTFPNTSWDTLHKYNSITVDGRDYEPYDAYDVVTTYAEGELTWIAKRNDKSKVVDLINPPYGISVEKNRHEVEHYESEYLNSDDVYEAFNLQKEPKAKGFHILKPFERPFMQSLSRIAFWVLFVIGLFMAVAILDGDGKIIQQFTSHHNKAEKVKFYVNDTKYLVDLELKSKTSKELDNFKVEIHKDNKILFSLIPNAAYLFSQETGQIKEKLHPWEKDSKHVRASLNLEEKGEYILSIDAIDTTLTSEVSVVIKEASSRLNYLMWFLALTLFSWLLVKFFKWRYERKVENERGIVISRDVKNYLIPLGFFIIVLIALAIFMPDLIFPLIFITIIVLGFARFRN